jgi:hypothetical protein
MSGAITESILTIAVILAAATTSVAMIQSIYNLDSTNLSLLDTARESALTQFKIVFASNSSSTSLKLWVKNVGLREVDSALLGRFALFLGPRGNVRFVPFNASQAPSWSYALVNDLDSDSWVDPGESFEISVSWSGELPGGDWYARLTTPAGAVSEYTFSLGG